MSITTALARCIYAFTMFDIQDVDGNGNNACQVYFNRYTGASARRCINMVESFKALGLNIWAPTADGRTPEQIIDGLLALVPELLPWVPELTIPKHLFIRLRL